MSILHLYFQWRMFAIIMKIIHQNNEDNIYCHVYSSFLPSVANVLKVKPEIQLIYWYFSNMQRGKLDD